MHEIYNGYQFLRNKLFLLNVQLGQEQEYVHVHLAMSKLEQNVCKVSFV